MFPLITLVSNFAFLLLLYQKLSRVEHTGSNMVKWKIYVKETRRTFCRFDHSMPWPQEAILEKQSTHNQSAKSDRNVFDGFLENMILIRNQLFRVLDGVWRQGALYMWQNERRAFENRVPYHVTERKKDVWEQGALSMWQNELRAFEDRVLYTCDRKN